MLKQPLKWQWPYRGVLCKLYEWLGFVLQGHPATVREYRLERELEEKRRNIRFLQNQLRYTRADNFDYAQLPMQYRDTLADIFCYPLEILRDSPHFQVREAQDKSSWDVVTEQCCLGGCDLSIYTLPSERDALLYAAVLHAVGYRPPNNKACEACYEKYMKTKIKRRHQK